MKCFAEARLLIPGRSECIFGEIVVKEVQKRMKRNQRSLPGMSQYIKIADVVFPQSAEKKEAKKEKAATTTANVQWKVDRANSSPYRLNMLIRNRSSQLDQKI